MISCEKVVCVAVCDDRLWESGLCGCVVITSCILLTAVLLADGWMPWFAQFSAGCRLKMTADEGRCDWLDAELRAGWQWQVTRQCLPEAESAAPCHPGSQNKRRTAPHQFFNWPFFCFNLYHVDGNASIFQPAFSCINLYLVCFGSLQGKTRSTCCCPSETQLDTVSVLSNKQTLPFNRLESWGHIFLSTKCRRNQTTRFDLGSCSEVLMASSVVIVGV